MCSRAGLCTYEHSLDTGGWYTGGASAAGGGDRKRKAPQSNSDKFAWVQEGAMCEVQWDGEYWQAKILRVKTKHQSSGGGSLLPSSVPVAESRTCCPCDRAPHAAREALFAVLCARHAAHFRVRSARGLGVACFARVGSASVRQAACGQVWGARELSSPRFLLPTSAVLKRSCPRALWLSPL